MRLKVKVTKVKGQDRRVEVKVVWKVLYPIDSSEVGHACVFILEIYYDKVYITYRLLFLF